MRRSGWLICLLLCLPAMAHAADGSVAAFVGEGDQPTLSEGGPLGAGGSDDGGGPGLEADDFTGATTYSVALPVPPGRGNLAPRLVLNYHSYRRNPNSWVGSGWELDLGQIRRTPTPQTGLIDYVIGSNFEVHFAGKTEELVLVEPGASPTAYGLDVAPGITVNRYAAKIDESHTLYFHLHQAGSSEDAGWIVIDTGGRRYRFGATTNAKDAIYAPDGEYWIAGWLLEEVRDANENVIAILYAEDRLPATIVYSDIEITFEKSADVRYFPVFKQTFLQPTQVARLKKIVVSQVGPGAPTPLQIYTLWYVKNPLNQMPQLTSVQREAPKGVNLPPYKFEYVDGQLFWSDKAQYVPAKVVVDGAVNHGLLGERTDIIDMNGDAIPDQISGFPFQAGQFAVRWGSAQGFSDTPTMWDDPLSITKCAGRVRTSKSTTIQTKNLKDESVSFTVDREWCFLLDLNGDRLPDRFYATSEAENVTQAQFVIYWNTGKSWTEKANVWNDPYQGEYAGTTDLYKGLVDLNGDGLPDRVIGNPGQGGFDVYWNTGVGFRSKAEFWADPMQVGFGDHPAVGSVYSYHVDNSAEALKDYKARKDGLYVAIRDVNGDALPDRIFYANVSYIAADGDTQVRPGFFVAMNLGGRRWAVPTLGGSGECPGGASQCVFFNASTTFAMVDPAKGVGVQSAGFLDTDHAGLIDVDQDGYLDRVAGDADTGKLYVFLYQGMDPEQHHQHFATTPIVIDDPVADLKALPEPPPPGSVPLPPEGDPPPALPDPDAPPPENPWAARGYIARSAKTLFPPSLINLNREEFLFIRDMNGDGFPDRVVIESVEQLYADPAAPTPSEQGPVQTTYRIYPLRLNPIEFSEAPNLLVNQPHGVLRKVEDTNGNVTEIEYAPSSWALVEDQVQRFLPMRLWLAFKIFHTDVATPYFSEWPESVRHPTSRWITRTFAGGNFFVHYAAGLDDGSVPANHYIGRFNGFQRVTRRESPLGAPSDLDWHERTIITKFHQALSEAPLIQAPPDPAVFDESGYGHVARSGKAYAVDTFEGQTLRRQQVKTWSVGNGLFNNVDCITPTCTLFFAQEISRQYEGDSTAFERRVDYVYDEFGNIVQRKTFGNGQSLLTEETDYYAADDFALSLQLRDRAKERRLVKNGLWRKTAWQYDQLGNPVHDTYFTQANATNALQVDRTFGMFGTLKSEVGADGVLHKYAYDAAGVFPVSETITTPNGKALTTTRAYHRFSGALLQELSPHKVGTRWERDAFGRPLEEWIIASNGDEWLSRKFAYFYVDRQVENVTLSLLETRVWDIQQGFAWTASRPRHITYTDGRGRTLQHCERSERGNFRTVQERWLDRNRRHLRTDPTFGACKWTTTLTGGNYVSHFDLFGRPIKEIPKAGEAVSPTGPTTISYSLTGESLPVVQILTPDQQTRTEWYDAAGRLATVNEAYGSAVTFNYNPVGDLLSVVQNNQLLIQNTYDLVGRKLSMDDADLGAWNYTYDAKNRLESQTDAKGQTTTFDYDALGRVTKRRFHAVGGTIEKTESYTYDAGAAGLNVKAGELGKVVEYDASGAAVRTTRFGYDPAYRRPNVVQRVLPTLGSFTETTETNEEGQIIDVQYDAAGSVYYRYNAIGGLWRVCDTSSCNKEVYYQLDPETAYNDQGQLLEERFGNGVRATNDYFSASHRLQLRRTIRQSSVYTRHRYHYDVMGNLTEIDDQQGLIGGGEKTAMTYDALQRLVGYTPGLLGAPIAFKYDESGNPLKNGEQNLSYQYTGPQPHAVTQVGSRTLTYDANGHLAADGYRTLAWNAANQLSHVTLQNGAIAHYEYDFTGARVQQRVVTQNTYGAPEGWEIYTLSEALELRVPLQWPGSQSGTDPPDGAGQAPVANLAQATATLHVLVGGQRIASRGVVEVVGDAPKGAVAKSAAEWFIYHHTDHLGSSHLMTEGRSAGHYAGLTYPKGSVVQRFDYAAFGSETFALNPNLPFDPRFTGQTYDLDTGLYYYRARYYDPALARFISPDTMVPDPTTPHSYNRYTYVRNNPLRWVDPSGHTDLQPGDPVDYDKFPSFDETADVPMDYEGPATIGGDKAWSGGCCDGAAPSGDRTSQGPTGGDGGITDVVSSNESVSNGGWGSGLLALNTHGPIMYNDMVESGAVGGGGAIGRGLGGRALSGLGRPKMDRLVIGKVKDLQRLNPGERSLLGRLPDMGGPKANWHQNSGKLRQELSFKQPIRDATVDPITGVPIENTGFLRAERYLMEDQGWNYDPKTTLWNPPGD